MTCRRAFDADLIAVLRGEGDAAFRAHYPGCPECAAEVRVWSELEGLLRAGAPPPDAHPEPELLLAFADAPATLDGETRGTVERHLAGCRSCADEAKVLVQYEPGVLAGAASVAAAPAAVSPILASDRALPRPRARGDDASAGSWLGRLVWQPAFAYALVALLLVPIVTSQLSHLSEPTSMMDARREPEAQAVAPAPLAVPPPAPPPVVPPAAAPAPAMPPPRQAPPAGRAEQDTAALPRELMKRDRSAGAPAEARRAAEAPATKARSAAPPPPAEPAPAQAARVERADEHAARAPEMRARAEDAASARAPGAINEEVGQPIGGRRTDRLARVGGSDAVPAAPGVPATIELHPNTPTVLDFAVATRATALRIATPESLPPGPLDVVVRGRVGRELRTRVADRANAIVMEIPSEWLAPGDYVVTLQPVAADGAEAAPTVLQFTVRAP